ncbi:MAG: YihY/virulence factor BrkB family protein, partial [Candidatus Aphodosoma sp.]
MALKQRIKKLIDFLMHDIFRVTENELGRGMRILVRLLKKIVLSIRGFIDDDLTVKASALTYYT